MRIVPLSTILALSLAATTSCALGEFPEGSDAIDAQFLVAGDLSSMELAAILELANTASFAVLDDEVALDRRAAQNIVDHRNGADGQAGTGDDDLFDDLDELDAISYVGQVALDRLHAFAMTNLGTGSGDGCLIISEYVEGWGNYNKAVELYNCGEESLQLADYRLCMVRNGANECTSTAELGDGGSLAAGAVFTVCRRQAFHPAGLDPIPTLAQACDLESPGTMTFNGDDRLMVLRSDGSIADSLGRFGYQPPISTWSNRVLSRCNFEAADGVSYYNHRDYFIERSSGSVTGFGQAPIEGCE